MFDLLNTRIGELLNKATLITFADVWKEVFKDEQFKEEILDWIRWEQLFDQGVNENNEIIGYYSEYTQYLNKDKIANTPYTLYDTGDFYNSFIITVLSDSIEINADPIKSEATEYGFDVVDLFKEYGEGIIGLTDESKEKLAKELIKRFNVEYRRLLSIN
jgi:hypothetical protein